MCNNFEHLNYTSAGIAEVIQMKIIMKITKKLQLFTKLWWDVIAYNNI